MEDYKRQLLELSIAGGILGFGEFTLKSGRVSPYFFNAGRFSGGATLSQLASCYAAAIVDSGIEFDVMLGPAYKGIPLVSATAVALFRDRGIDVPYCFNRKEAKDHGEGGVLVGAPLTGRVLIVEDIITAGTAIREVLQLIEASGATAAGVVVAIDREERGQEGDRSAIAELEAAYNLRVASVIGLSDVVAYLENDGNYAAELRSISDYRARYGAAG
ncbi:MAG: orotate phosphoribosyltransferase [Gammaproteobacteria bacterium]|nr:orotate phosphoribosyltransferase [Gammaproteobacteria bacterium]